MIHSWFANYRKFKVRKLHAIRAVFRGQPHPLLLRSLIEKLKNGNCFIAVPLH